ncbi:LUD domain-containing protein [Halorhabdus rudnickae]|uniref:LUD domain-containing protein n=1 Tax=Halorhabdus rudnickae TaxID=1775544 RepID=UPI001FCE78BD|nr:LUD domain-containing protein [Halorhabdus rudnickae]
MSPMQTESPVDRFVASLDGMDVTWTRTDAGRFESAVVDVLEQPAVGVPIPIEGVSLPRDIDTDPDPETVRTATTGVTPATGAVADYGSVLLESGADGEELMSLFPETHVPVLRERDVVDTMAEAFDELGSLLRGDQGDVIVATGPSATSDMGDLVRGVHGPTDVHVVIVEQ